MEDKEKFKKETLDKWEKAFGELPKEDITFPKSMKYVPNNKDYGIKVGELRLIPAGYKIWSITNQSNFILTEDTIIEIAHTCIGSDYVFVKPKQLLFPLMIPSLIDLGNDEWSLSYSKTIPYTIPECKLNNI